MKSISELRDVLTAKTQAPTAFPSTEPTLLDDWAASAQMATLTPSLIMPAARHAQHAVRLAVKWTLITVVCSAVLWPIVDSHINYCFKSVPQYLTQEWVWWVKTAR